MEKDPFIGLPPLSEPHKRILLAKEGRLRSFKHHIERGGTPLTYLPLLIGDGYGGFWRTKKRYRVVKGSRASKKTVTVAREYIYNMMKYPESNLLVVRKVGAVNKDSTYAELRKAIFDLGVEDKWKAKVNPLEIIYKPTGQKILFRGLDDPQKISGVTVEVGHLCWVWIEEAYEMREEREFDFIDESIRGILPEHLWYQLTLTLNPWNKGHWIKKRFFDPIFGENEEFKDNPREHPQIFALSTNFFVNEFIDDSFKESMVRMKEHNPRRYHVAGLGNWGITAGLIFEHWKETKFNKALIERDKRYKILYGLDFGFTSDPTAVIKCAVDEKREVIYLLDEIYTKGTTNKKLAEMIKYKGWDKQVIVCDSSEPKSIKDLFDNAIRRVKKSRKGNDSVINGIDKLLDYDIIACRDYTPNACTELDNYMWDEDKPNTPTDDFNHLMDAFRYATEDTALASGTLKHKIIGLQKDRKRKDVRNERDKLLDALKRG